MNIHSERSEFLPTSYHRSSSRVAASTASSTIQSYHADDKDSIYTFSNDESDFMDSNGKFGSRLSSSTTIMDKNLNDTRNYGLKASIRTYSKKKASSSTSLAAAVATSSSHVSLRHERKRSTALAVPATTTYSDIASCSPLQSMSSFPLPSYTEDYSVQSFRSNGSSYIGKYSLVFFWFQF